MDLTSYNDVNDELLLDGYNNDFDDSNKDEESHHSIQNDRSIAGLSKKNNDIVFLSPLPSTVSLTSTIITTTDTTASTTDSNANVSIPKSSVVASSNNNNISNKNDENPLPSQVAASSTSTQLNNNSLYYRLLNVKQSHLAVTKFKGPEMSSMHSKFISFMSGEPEIIRKTRAKLTWYSDMLSSDVIMFKRIKSHHKKKSSLLAQEFEQLESQLIRWGLIQLLPSFRLQAWIRLSKALLLRAIANYCINIFQIRYDRSLRVVSQFNSDCNLNEHDPTYSITAYNDFCLLPDALLNRERQLSIEHEKLLKIDSVNFELLNRFRSISLPALETKSYEVRRSMLNKMLDKFTLLLQPTSLVNLSLDKLSWEEYCLQYDNRITITKAIEREFSMLIEDDREREGRLLRRWFAAVLSPIKMNNSSSSSNSGSNNSNKNSNDNNNIKDPLLNPKCISAFIKYFALNVIAVTYSLALSQQDALFTLTETLIYKRISTRIFRYSSIALHNKDINWRRKCKVVSLIDPVTYGVPSQYMFNGLGDIHDKIDVTDDICSSSDESIASDYKLYEERKYLFLHRLQKVNDSTYSLNGSINYAKAYGKTIKIFSQINTFVTPKEIVYHILLSLKVLQYDAIKTSDNGEFLGADTLFPIFVLVIIYSHIPCMNLILVSNNICYHCAHMYYTDLF